MTTEYYLAFVHTGSAYCIFSPDFPEITSQGYSLDECLYMGQDALATCCQEYAKAGWSLPAPSDLNTARQKIQRQLADLDFAGSIDAVTFHLFSAVAPCPTPAFSHPVHQQPALVGA